MGDNVPDVRTRFTRDAARPLSGVTLCALLLIFCTNSRLARYETSRPTNLAAMQVYFDIEKVAKDLSQPTALISLAGLIAVPVLPPNKTGPLPVVVSTALPFTGFGPESRLRPPPAR